jgi:hypothetical protein
VDHPGWRLGSLLGAAVAAGVVSCDEPLTCTDEACVSLVLNLRFASADNQPGEEVQVDLVTDAGEATFTCAVGADGFFEACHDGAEGITLNSVLGDDSSALEFTMARSEGGRTTGPETIDVTARVGDDVLFEETFHPVYQDLGEINGEGCGVCEMAASIERDVAR